MIDGIVDVVRTAGRPYPPRRLGKEYSGLCSICRFVDQHHFRRSACAWDLHALKSLKLMAIAVLQPDGRSQQDSSMRIMGTDKLTFTYLQRVISFNDYALKVLRKPIFPVFVGIFASREIIRRIKEVPLIHPCRLQESNQFLTRCRPRYTTGPGYCS